MDALYRELRFEILMALDYTDILSVCQINRKWRSTCNDPDFWTKKLRKDFPLRSKYIYYEWYLTLIPRELYRLLLGKSKMIEIYSDTIQEVISDISYVSGMGLEKEVLMKANSIFKNHIAEYPLLRGDVIHFGWLGYYHNIGYVMWDGEKMVKLDYEIDIYGDIPPEFSFPEFPLDHFWIL